jgi:hypothetical protein
MMPTGQGVPDEFASSFSRVALENVQREFPNKLDHVMNDAGEVRSPRQLHPVFYGSYDWHSSVHMHWLLARLLRTSGDLPEAQAIARIFDGHFTAANVAAECAYLDAPSRQSFERTYGWAWLLKLQSELILLGRQVPARARWSEALLPLADAFVARYLRFLPLAHHPIRAGTHANSAFGLYFALEFACLTRHVALKELLCAKAHAWFAADHHYPADYEPGGDDFLSGGLIEAALMAQVLGDRFSVWWEGFRPDDKALQIWCVPVTVSDRTDPKLTHLDGLNLSRAWCWKSIQRYLPPAQKACAQAAVDVHLKAGFPQARTGDYVGTHWLASFALLALTEE